MCTANALYTQFTAFSTPASHWIGFQIIQGIGAGFGMQMSSLAVQLELMDSPQLLPVGIALVTFTQSLGSTVLQVVAGTIFNNGLAYQLTVHAGLTAEKSRLLLGGEITRVREITDQNFPSLRRPILESYNSAITKVFVCLVLPDSAFHPLMIPWCICSSFPLGPQRWHFFSHSALNGIRFQTKRNQSQ